MAKNLFSFQIAQTGSGAHAASLSVSSVSPSPWTQRLVGQECRSTPSSSNVRNIPTRAAIHRTSSQRDT